MRARIEKVDILGWTPSYEDPEDQAPVGVIAPGGEIQNVAYVAPWMD